MGVLGTLIDTNGNGDSRRAVECTHTLINQYLPIHALLRDCTLLACRFCEVSSCLVHEIDHGM